MIGFAAGFVVVSYPIVSGFLASTYLLVFMGLAAVVAGAAHIFSRSGSKRSLWGIILGVLYVVFGVTVVFNPLITQAIVVLLLPFWALITGGLSIVGSYRGAGAGWLMGRNLCLILVSLLLSACGEDMAT